MAITSVVIPNSVVTGGDNAFDGASSLTRITVVRGNSAYSSDSSGVLFNRTKTMLINYPAGSASSSYAIPGSVTFTGNAPSVGFPSFAFIGSNAKAYRAAGLTGYGADGDDFNGLIVATPVG